MVECLACFMSLNSLSLSPRVGDHGGVLGVLHVVELQVQVVEQRAEVRHLRERESERASERERERERELLTETEIYVFRFLTQERD